MLKAFQFFQGTKGPRTPPFFYFIFVNLDPPNLWKRLVQTLPSRGAPIWLHFFKSGFLKGGFCSTFLKVDFFL